MKVSLVMAVYNGESYLNEALAGILAQSYNNMEIIIVNDCSTDSTTDILRRINDKRVQIINLSSNRGAAYALNVGIEASKGELIAIHDADDISIPSRIEKQVNYMLKDPKLVAVGSFIECIPGNDIKETSISHMRSLERNRNSVSTWAEVRANSYKDCPFTHGALLISKQALLKVGGYNPNYRIAYDYDMFLRLTTIGPMINIPEVLYKYRISPNSLSNSDLKETSVEFLKAAASSIANNSFSYKKDKTRVAVFGSKEGCRNFQNLTMDLNNLAIITNISSYKKEEIMKAFVNYRGHKIDAFIILSQVREENGFMKFLKRQGLKENIDYFVFWSIL